MNEAPTPSTQNTVETQKTLKWSAFWSGFRLGFAQGCAIGAPFVALTGCAIGLLTDRVAMAYFMVITGAILFWLGCFSWKQEKESEADSVSDRRGSGGSSKPL